MSALDPHFGPSRQRGGFATRTETPEFDWDNALRRMRLILQQLYQDDHEDE